jgi:hypothetical protein
LQEIFGVEHPLLGAAADPKPKISATYLGGIAETATIASNKITGG